MDLKLPTALWLKIYSALNEFVVLVAVSRRGAK